jgi:hypothetical protein
MITENGSIETDRFIKPTNPQLYLHFKSNHPEHVFKAIVYGQAVTVKTICSKEEFVQKHFQNLREKFGERGYPVEIIERNLEKGLSLERVDLLKPKTYPTQAVPVPAGVPKPVFRPTFIITFNPHNPPLKKWLKETFPILQADTKMLKIYKTPPAVTFRQPQSLKQYFVRSRFKNLPFTNCEDMLPPGCYKHEHPRVGRPCLCCPKIHVSTRFRSTFTGLEYRIRHRFTCKSSYVVYLVSCKACLAQYVGKTTKTMNTRHNGHKDEIKNASTPLGRHFTKCGLGNYSLQIIDCVKSKENEALLVLEGTWQNRLATFHQHGGMNSRDEQK